MTQSISYFTFLFVIAFSSYAQNAEGVKTEQLSDSSKIYNVVEIQPEYPGGYQEMVKFIKKQMRYPKSARKEKITGSVYVSFVVNKDGRISKVTLIKRLHPDCDKEAERMVSAMPKWKPGKVNGKAVATRFNLPITFNPSSGD